MLSRRTQRATSQIRILLEFLHYRHPCSLPDFPPPQPRSPSPPPPQPLHHTTSTPPIHFIIYSALPSISAESQSCLVIPATLDPEVPCLLSPVYHSAGIGFFIPLSCLRNGYRYTINYHPMDLTSTTTAAAATLKKRVKALLGMFPLILRFYLLCLFPIICLLCRSYPASNLPPLLVNLDFLRLLHLRTMLTTA